MAIHEVPMTSRRRTWISFSFALGLAINVPAGVGTAANQKNLESKRSLIIRSLEAQTIGESQASQKARMELAIFELESMGPLPWHLLLPFQKMLWNNYTKIQYKFVQRAIRMIIDAASANPDKLSAGAPEAYYLMSLLRMRDIKKPWSGEIIKLAADYGLWPSSMLPVAIDSIITYKLPRQIEVPKERMDHLYNFFSSQIEAGASSAELNSLKQTLLKAEKIASLAKNILLFKLGERNAKVYHKILRDYFDDYSNHYLGLPPEHRSLYISDYDEVLREINALYRTDVAIYREVDNLFRSYRTKSYIKNDPLGPRNILRLEGVKKFRDFHFVENGIGNDLDVETSKSYRNPPLKHKMLIPSRCEDVF
jgi:hypothetical protein